ncbi:hypothetical protein K7X08_000930 [Anisodus acutangulus]|uniref:Major facilitator superfamily (MFS) profile domain-containing protein n=1 Tax=Anisodus acutangulus TaxID=402998 RepID=A0A9Q1RK44_9SOLA|nr:hypothetical protein K7X08_000930 [Anisodus acutangulus]
MGGSLFGYDLGVSGRVTSMDDFLKEFFPKVYRRKHAHLEETDYCKYDNQILTLFTSSLYFAALVSTFEHCNADRWSVSSWSRHWIWQPVPLYLSEMAPAKVQGAVNQLTTCLGILIANFINYATDKIHPWGWRLSLGLATVPAAIMFIGGLFLPETPNSLVEQGRLQEAREVLEKVMGTTKVDAEFSDLKDASDAARAIKHPFRNLLQRKNRPQLVIAALGIPAFQQLTGMNSILFYAPVIFQSLGFGSGAWLYSSAITSAGVEMICVLVAVAVTLALKFGEGLGVPVSPGNKICRTDHGGLCQYGLHSPHCTMLPCVSLSPQIRNFSGVHGPDIHYELLHLLPLA